jgi:AraC-like DNA-binding protein
LLRVPLAELTNRVVDLDLIVGSSIERLRQRLIEAPSLDRRFQILERYLLERIASARAPRAEVGYALTRLARIRGAVRMRSLAVETGISQKHLIDLFHEQVGMAPKRYARIVRLQRAAQGGVVVQLGRPRRAVRLLRSAALRARVPGVQRHDADGVSARAGA